MPTRIRPGFPESGHNAKKKRRGNLTGKQYRKWRKRQAKAARRQIAATSERIIAKREAA